MQVIWHASRWVVPAGLALWGLWLTCGTGCSRTSTPTDTPPAETNKAKQTEETETASLPAAVEATPQTESDPDESFEAHPEDHSLTPEEYSRLNLPDISEPWTPEQCLIAAIRVLKPLAEKDHTQLPQFRSETSGEVFARIVSMENIAWLNDPARPLDDRWAGFVKYLQALFPVFEIYRQAPATSPDPADHAKVFDQELVELFHVLSQTAVAGSRIRKAILKTLPDDDPRRSTQQATYRQMQKGFAQSIFDALLWLSRRQEFRPGARIRLSQYIGQALPELMPEMTYPDRYRILQTIENLVGSEDNPSVRKALEFLQVNARMADRKAVKTEPPQESPLP